MTLTPSVTFEKNLLDAIKKYVSSIVDEEIEEAQKRLKSRAPEIMAKIGLSVQQQMDVLQNDAVLQIRMTPRLG